MGTIPCAENQRQTMIFVPWCFTGAYPLIIVHYSFPLVVNIKRRSFRGLLFSFHWSFAFRGEFQAHSHNTNLMSRELNSASHICSQLASCYTAIQKGHEEAVCNLNIARNKDRSGGHQVDQKCDIPHIK